MIAKLNSKQKRKIEAKKIEQDGPYCIWCGKEVPEDERTLEHLLPTKYGGSNQQENLRLACRGCNQSRGHKLLPPTLNLTWENLSRIEPILHYLASENGLKSSQ